MMMCGLALGALAEVLFRLLLLFTAEGAGVSREGIGGRRMASGVIQQICAEALN